MRTCTYWFSGTGNSLWVARQIAARLSAEISPIANQLSNQSAVVPETIILVFPVYNHLIPWIVQRFIDQFDALANRYIVAVCTYGDSPGISLEYLANRIKANGGALAGGFAIQMPYNYISPSSSLRSFVQPFPLREISTDAAVQSTAAASARLNHIIQFIQNRAVSAPEIEYAFIERLAGFLNLRNTLQKSFWLKKAGYHEKAKMSSIECVQLMDYGFSTSSSCTGCRTCETICPVNNIQIISGIPQWQHHCEQCFACLQWCPSQAIEFTEGTQGCSRYHHPQIQLKDMILK